MRYNRTSLPKMSISLVLTWLLLYLPACSSRSVLFSGESTPAIDSQTSTAAEAKSSSPSPTDPDPDQAPSSPSPASNSAGHPNRWKKYQAALASRFLPSQTGDPPGLCEWQILGHRDQKIFVWALCQESGKPDGAAVSAPAVLHLHPEGPIRRVEMPGDGESYSSDVRRMFPEEYQEIIFKHQIDTEKMWDHLQLRQKHPQPPLIHKSGTPLP